MTEVLFYHLQRKAVTDVLPELVQKVLERGWRAVIQTAAAERVGELSTALWEWRDDAFLPHGSRDDGMAEYQPVWITAEDENPNGANIRFLVDGADCASLDGLQRLVLLFDGRDDAAVAAARDRWKALAGQGHEVTYWRQDGRGQWKKQQ